MMENILSQFENETIEVYPFLAKMEHDSYNKYGITFARIKIIDKYLVQAE